MGNSTTLLDLLASGQTQKEIVANSLFDAASPSTLFGRRASTTSALTWGYYGGTLGVNGVLTQISNGTVALTASATNYVESTTAGVVSVNTSGFTAGRIALYVVVTGASSVTSYTDNRAYGFTGARQDQLMFLNTAYTLVSQTAAQKAFNGTANGQVSLASGTHDFECILNLSAMSSISGSFGFGFAGGATFTEQWFATAIKSATLSTASAWQQSFNTAENTTLATASTATVGYAVIRGRLNVTVSGTVIPQISLTVAAAANVGAGSYFKVGALGSGSGTTNIVVGTWS
jgi:hypothetical protein